MVILTTLMMASTVMRGGSDTIQIVMHQTLPGAAQSALNALLKDTKHSLGRNNHPWDILQAQRRSENLLFCLIII